MTLSTHFTPWTALLGGSLIGLSAGLFVLLNGRIAGISGLLGSLLSRRGEGRGEKLLFVIGLLVSPWIWSLFAKLPESSFQAGGYALVLAGLLVGIGTRYGAGCTSGHGICGLSRWSLRSLVAVGCFMGSGFAGVYFIRHLLGA
ncbi:putative membrane protein YedE/YeeE [Pseudomonas sp. BIGb0381]|uniref:YeeE/YedE family protein n=1 Tax=Pseudomonas sp. BIGb0381 TaxID=2940608 RepID=UPI00216A86FD|nr:YeeE/YedE family protein [Pseudomonas sp. BIGb0381]MCS4313240.1 putative membrane protein YedE/YeeE [Pseudomonas sp. BIGb0381]